MTELTVTHQPRQNYTPEEIDTGLRALAIHHGNERRAAAELEKIGLPIPHQTLGQWKRKTRTERYLEIQRQEMPRLRAMMAEQAEELTTQVWDVARENIHHLSTLVQDETLSFKERADAQYRLVLAGAIPADKALLLRGDPTQITEHRDLRELGRGLKRLGVVESTAEDVTDE